MLRPGPKAKGLDEERAKTSGGPHQPRIPAQVETLVRTLGGAARGCRRGRTRAGGASLPATGGGEPTSRRIEGNHSSLLSLPTPQGSNWSGGGSSPSRTRSNDLGGSTARARKRRSWRLLLSPTHHLLYTKKTQHLSVWILKTSLASQAQDRARPSPKTLVRPTLALQPNSPHTPGADLSPFHRCRNCAQRRRGTATPPLQFQVATLTLSLRPRQIEQQFAVVCFEHAETYFNLITGVRPSTLSRLSPFVPLPARPR